MRFSASLTLLGKVWKNIHGSKHCEKIFKLCNVCNSEEETKGRHCKKQQLQILWSKLYFWRRRIKSVIWKSIFAVRQRRKCRADFSWVLQLNWVSTNERSRTRQAGQDADFLANYCSIDDISGNTSIQLKVLILYRNGEVIIQKLFDNAIQWNL